MTMLLAFLLLSVPAARAVDVPTSLQVQDGKLSCPPYDCSVPLKEGQRWEMRHEGGFFMAQRMEGDNALTTVLLSSDIIDIPAYSGKPIRILIEIDNEGFIHTSRLISHAEPSLLVGIPEIKRIQLIEFYEGKNIRDKVKVGDPEPGYVNVDMITGATVTALVADQTLLTAARQAAVALGILEGSALTEAELTDTFEPKTWQELLDMGAIGNLTIRHEEMHLPESDKPWLDLYWADLVHPMIGRNLLGDSTYNWLMGKLKPGESALMIAGRGESSFKGSGFVRGGIYDRFHLEQGLNSFSFHDLDYENLYTIEADDAPKFKEKGIFVIRDGNYDRTSSWEMVFLASRLTGETALSKEFQTFRQETLFPDDLMLRKMSLAEQVWRDKSLSIAGYIALWMFVITVFSFRKRISDNKKLLNALHNTVLVTSIVVIGIYFRSQPSVVNVFTIFDLIFKGGNWSTFLTDPYLSSGWILIFITTLIWGRSLFCGWLCPYGAIQELLFKVRVAVTPFTKSIEPPAHILKWLRPMRYVIFFVLFATALFSIELAEKLAEIEPFKTTWNVGVFNRSAGFVAYWWLLIALGLMTE
ncbi:MAG: 4Fe-4S binding protein, partial [Deltaproteobacteria bacterium]|nr:4Fe-4S binding protein [Deltaproteobacteria bacterium]